MTEGKANKKRAASLSLDELCELCEQELLVAKTEAELRDAYARYAGKDGVARQRLVTALQQASPQEKKAIGQAGNAALARIQAAMERRLQALAQQVRDADLARHLDTTLPGRPKWNGSLHPITQVRRDAESIFSALGFSIASGPQVETDFHNFEALGMPAHHPARSAQDTFYVPGGLLLRTHTSSVQIRAMIDNVPPLRLIAPGRVYRNEEDPTHAPAFTQLEGFAVDRGLAFPHLKGTLQFFVERFFGSSTPYRLRASFFPFVEPGAELDIQCIFCKGRDKTCKTCKGTGFIEVLGCGLIHPTVFTRIDGQRNQPAYQGLSGFAFGMGLDRLAMLRYGINDLRLFFSGDVRLAEMLA